MSEQLGRGHIQRKDFVRRGEKVVAFIENSFGCCGPELLTEHKMVMINGAFERIELKVDDQF